MIQCLHGFLGQGRDWDFLPFPKTAPDLFALPVHGSMEDFARRPRAAGAPLAALIGYSMGGRLALHTLLARPEAFGAAVIVSAGLGIEDEEERPKRREQDEMWARRFEVEDWQTVVRAWNAQALFAGLPEPARKESDFRRDALAHALRAWSAAAHPPLAPRLPSITTPILWVAGERDAKYVAEARRAVAALPNAELWICPASGHRVPWEQPQLFVQRVTQFLEAGIHDEMEDPSPISGHPLPGD